MSWLRKYYRNLGVLSIYCVLTMVMTWPLIAQISTHLAGNDIDVWLNPWANWWTRKAFTEGLDFYHTKYLFWPHETGLYFHSFSHFNSGLWMLLEPITGAIAAQNITTLVSYVLSAFGTYLLVLYLTNNHLAAFVSGFVFSFCPWHIEQSSHPVINTTQWIPLFMLCLLRVLRERRARWAVGAAVFLWLSALSSWYLFLFSLMLGGLYVLLAFLTDTSIRSQSTVRVVGGFAIIALSLIGPLVFPLVREYLSGQDYVAASGGDRPVDLLGLVTPSHRHPVVGRFMPHGYSSRYPKSTFIGWTVLVLAVYAGVRLWRRTYFWALAAVVFLVISLGPYLQIGGVLYENVHFPWGDAIKRFFRASDRFFVVVSLVLAVLAGYGLAHLASSARGTRWKKIGVWVLGGVIFFELLHVPFPTLQPTVPAFYERIADEPGEFAILDLPMGRRRYYMYYQTFHERPLVEGTISRPSTDSFVYINSNPFLSKLREDGVMDPVLTDISRQLMTLAQDGIRYLIIHKARIGPDTLAQWRDYLTVPPLYESDELVVYRTHPPHGADPTLMGEWEPGLGLIQVRVRSGRVLSQGSVVEVDARWFVTRILNEDLGVRMALVGEAGELAQSENFVVSPDWPTSQWPAGSVAVDRYTWQIDPFVSPGDYSLVLAVGDALEGAISLGQVEVMPLPRLFDVPQMARVLSVDFKGQMRLLGYDLQQEGDSALLVLHWQALRRMDVPYKVFVHMYDEGTREVVVQDDAMPRRWAYPTTWWEAGEVVSDEIPLSLVGVPSGAYRLSVGVYEPDGERLLVSTGDDHLVLDDEVVVP